MSEERDVLMPGRRVLALDPNEDMLGLLDTVLTDSGYVARVYRDGDVTAEEITQFAPDCLVLDASPYNAPGLTLVQELVAAKVSIPFVLTTTNVTETTRQLEAAGEDLPPHHVLAKPFDLNDFENAVAGLQGMHATDTAAIGAMSGLPDQIMSGVREYTDAYPVGMQATFNRVSDELRAQQRNILLRWIQNVATLDAHLRRRFIRIRDVMDHVPVLLDGLIVALQAVTPAEEFAEMEQGKRCYNDAREHAHTRRTQGFTAQDVIREQQVLRDEIILALWRIITTDPQSIPFDHLSLLQLKISHAFDRVVVIVLDFYGEKA